ncbi:MAG: PQQ-dependent sugar dehydrogenase [Synechococcales cyanobacterium M58_A2018_015]|nr:PQQ-dependent sugar dehydrogenase [Synechococcales cyanobacterium M58_A2018_015]
MKFSRHLIRCSLLLTAGLVLSACGPALDAEQPQTEQPAEQPASDPASPVPAASPSPESSPAQPKTFAATPANAYRVETVVEGLQVPWAIEALPDGSFLITERPGRLRQLRDGQLSAPIPGVPPVVDQGEGGLMDLALHPDFQQNQWIYLSHVVRGDQGDLRTRVSRFRFSESGLTEPQVIFAGVPGTAGATHFGSRLAFGPDGKLYITLGERGDPPRSQDLLDLNGKTLRLNDDGSIPADNPYVGRSDARPEIFSYGHRNAQGIAFQPGTGLMFQTEHGPSGYDGRRGGDEVNVVEAGRNYGWPEISYDQRAPGMLPPLLLYDEAIAPAGATFYTGTAFPEWQNDFFFANLRGQTLVRVVLNGSQVVGQERLLERQYGRLRDVAQGLDGFLYITTSDNDGYGAGRAGGDRIIRLVPAS